MIYQVAFLNWMRQRYRHAMFANQRLTQCKLMAYDNYFIIFYSRLIEVSNFNFFLNLNICLEVDLS